MARLMLGLAILAAVVGAARAEIAVARDVPFTAPELVSALALRGATPSDVAVRAVSATAVELRTPAGAQRVELGAARGPAAARLVALQLATLDADPVVLAGRAPGPVVAGPPADAGWTLGVAGGGGHGVATIDFALTALRVDATRRRGFLRWGASVAWLHGLARMPDDKAAANADLGVVRAVAGFVVGRLEVVAGPELVAYRVAAASLRATAASPGVTVGAGGGVRVRLARWARWQAVATAEVDGFAHRVIVERDGMRFAATPRVALTAGLGLAWGRP